MSGEPSKQSGELGEKLAKEFLKLIGWDPSINTINIPCTIKSHNRKSHGDDVLYVYNSPFMDSTTEVIHVSVKHKIKGYPKGAQGLRTELKQHLTELNTIIACAKVSEDVNRSYQDKPFEEKAPHYAKQNLYAASLTESAYQHQPQFDAFIRKNNFSFKPYKSFGKSQQLERRQLVKDLVNQIWSPENLGKI